MGQAICLCFLILWLANSRFRQHIAGQRLTGHGSWLNMAEIELSVLARQCLDRRIPGKATLASEVAAWQHRLNIAEAKVDWRFTNDKARIKLKCLYPTLSC